MPVRLRAVEIIIEPRLYHLPTAELMEVNFFGPDRQVVTDIFRILQKPLFLKHPSVPHDQPVMVKISPVMSVCGKAVPIPPIPQQHRPAGAQCAD